MNNGICAKAGFAIPATILVIVVVSILALSGLYMAQNNLTANTGIRSSWKALNAADAGAQHALANWNGTAVGALNPGDSLDTGWRTLPDNSVHRTVILRVDDDIPGEPALYRLRTAGRPGGNETAQRVLVTMVRELSVENMCCDGAAKVQGGLNLRGSGANQPRIDGTDTPPWAGCPAGSDVTGIDIKDVNDIDIMGTPTIDGSPPINEDPSIDNTDFFTFGDLTYDDLAARADKRYSGGQTLDLIGPSTSGGSCNTSDPNNWGDPRNPGSPCWDYLPIIHVAGDVTLSGTGYGQGILLVDGSLHVRGEFEFYGIAVVLEEAEMEGRSAIIGGLLARNGVGGTLTSELRGRSVLQYSSCSVLRVETGAGAASPLAGRHWFEVLE